ncbi:MAG: glycosyltransferase family 2 protein [Chitinophagaceae bacterium]|nr:glycosyltransferase family 2 protein [Chitinophagaceae bacterium]
MLLEKKNDIQVSIVIPVYNEQKVISSLFGRLQELMNTSTLKLECVFVDDGSNDDTAGQLISICMNDPRFQYISFSRNFGHQVAIAAGLKNARAREAVFIIDADLQDPPELLTAFYQKLKEGYDIVYGIRRNRKESWIKRGSYYLFYRLINKIATLRFPVDAGDFSLISRRAVDVINLFPEEAVFIRGIRSWIGFKQAGMEYNRAPRVKGSTRYSYTKLLRLAMNGFYNFSEVPIRLISYLGIASISIALIYLIVTLINKIVYHTVPQGFTAILFTIVLFGGVQLLSIGVIGEYIIRTFFQVKNRPPFIIDKKIFDGVHSNEP